MRNQTMYRTCWLAAALLLAGCSEPKRDPLWIGSEVFLNWLGESDLLQSPLPVKKRPSRSPRARNFASSRGGIPAIKPGRHSP